MLLSWQLYDQRGLADAILAAMELAVESKLSKKPALDLNDTTAITVEQQQTLDQHKVS